MSSIRVLPPGLQNQIAAGEVVERPSSVVKELVENSLDAGAGSVQVYLEQGGQALVEVVDDGAGMLPDDMALAVTRHATSKIFSMQDLASVQSFGFRGEALPSIASVSRLRLSSCVQGRDEGSFLEILYGDHLEKGPEAMDPGTKVKVQNLLANIPARLKFLKTKNTEARKCSENFIRLALANLEVDLELYSEGRSLHRFFANENLKERLSRVWPEQLCRDLKDVELDQGDFRVHGVASSPENAQARGERMLFYVNNRAVKDKTLISALKQAYKGRLLSREYPQAVIFLEIPPEEVDVNVHPAKSEVRFRNEKHVFSLVSRAVGKVLDKNYFQVPEMPAEEVDVAGRADSPRYGPGPGETRPEMPVFREDFRHETAPDYGDRPPKKPAPPVHAPDMGLSYLGQVENNYLVFLNSSGRLLVVDQHGAHERVVFEYLKNRQGSVQSRMLAMPMQIELHQAEKNLLEEIWSMLRSLGFVLELHDERLLQVKGLPDILTSGEGIEALRSMLEDKARDMDGILIAMACRTSIKSGSSMTRDEALGLAHKLMQCKEMNFCPHGRPICMDLGGKELERLFKRR
ncbi:DNA mismatch repair endonuclease MutL [Desulfonatronospira sp. MSAO_Bac3]|uniref:DNA mismatch repair endonuclease MutL n=1 Tax=Desulfonatronospira sp. MSAO_Bac3 TaxID=2293857 RepID=UPI00257A1000|nr:DNA mismatch repair endonuclease MutL [Desulfonatronospira sp. MSAO_Bac3]